MNLRLDKNWQDYIDRQIEAGRFETASEVVQDALQKQMDYFARREVLIADLDAGLHQSRDLDGIFP